MEKILHFSKNVQNIWYVFHFSIIIEAFLVVLQPAELCLTVTRKAFPVVMSSLWSHHPSEIK